MVKDIVLTAAGIQKLKDELEHLETVERAEVIERIREARGFGDLSENAEYDEAKRAQGMVEGRILEITNILDNAKVAQTPKRITKVAVGTAVELIEQSTKTKLEFNLVGSAECDPSANEISDESPVGAAILGKKKGETATAKTPAGLKTYEIVSIKAIKG